MKVESQVLRQVLQWCDHHKDAPPLQHAGGSRSVERVFCTDNWDLNFFEATQEMLIDIVLAADFMDIERLFQLGCKTIARNTIETIQSEIFKEHRKYASPVFGVRHLNQARTKQSADWEEFEQKKEAAHLPVLNLHQYVQQSILDYILDCSALSSFFLLTRSTNPIATKATHEFRFAQLRTVGGVWMEEHAGHGNVLKLGFFNKHKLYSLYVDGTLTVWDLVERVAVFSRKEVVDVTVTPWGHLLTTDYDKRLEWRSVYNWQLVRTDDLPGLGDIYASPDFLAFLPIKQIYTPHASSAIRNEELIWLQIGDEGANVVKPPCPPNSRLLSFPPNARYIVYVTDDEIWFTTIEHEHAVVLSRRKWIQYLGFKQTSISISPDGSSIAIIESRGVLIYWTETKEAGLTICEHHDLYEVVRVHSGDFASCVVHSPDGQYFAVVTNIGRIMVCRIQKEGVREVLVDEGTRPNHRPEPWLASVASWSEDGEILAISSPWGWETIGIQNLIREAESKGAGANRLL